MEKQINIQNPTLIDFESIFEKILREPTEDLKINKKSINADPNKYVVFIIGLKLCENNNISIEDKEQVLYKLMLLFPNNFVLYFFMGVLANTKDKYRAMSWFRLAYQIDNEKLDNIINLFKLLFDNEYSNFIDNDILIHIYEKYKNDEKVLLLFSAIFAKKNNFYYSEMICNQLIILLEKKYKLNNNNKELNNILSNAYSNFIYICSFSLIYNDKFFEVIKKTFNFLKDNKNKLDISTRKEGFLNVLFYNYDYIYYDLNERNEVSKYIVNELFTTENKFDNKIRKQNKKIRIGYVSSDFISHAVSNFIIPILNNHDYSKFEIYLFTDKNYHQLKTIITNITVVDFQEKQTNECAKIINDYNIDILFDLNGFTSNNRLDVFSKNPAPIQITYIGYPNSLATDFIKYKITDYISDNMHSKQIYTEKLLRLPKTFLLFSPTAQQTPIKINFRKNKDTIILGSLNKELKNSKNTLEVWKKILNETTNTKLLIKLCSRDYGDNINKSIEYYKTQLNVTSDRIIIKPWQEHEKYIDLFREIDILLDTFPYSGTTTSCYALYNSIPIVTMYNVDYHIHNVTSSLLTHSGLSELVTYNENEYINKVKELCNDFEKINYYKKNIHKQFMKVMEPKEFMKNYEYMLTNLYNKEIKQFESYETLKEKYPHIYDNKKIFENKIKPYQFSYVNHTSNTKSEDICKNDSEDKNIEKSDIKTTPIFDNKIININGKIKIPIMK